MRDIQTVLDKNVLNKCKKYYEFIKLQFMQNSKQTHVYHVL